MDSAGGRIVVREWLQIAVGDTYNEDNLLS